MRILLLLPILLLTVSRPETAVADEAAERGLAIARQADEMDSGWQDQVARMRMTLRNKNGDESIRALRIRTLEMSGDGDRSLVVFDEPADVKGTALLSFSHALEPDDQWLFLPALKRVKRIASANKSGPFMGSEFAYEDMTSQEVEKYSYRWLRDEPVNGRMAFVVERIPAYAYSGYTRQVAWIDQQMYHPLRVEFYDRKDELLKTLDLEGYRQYLERYWRADSMTMVNHQTGKSTTLDWQDYRFGNGLTTRDFDRDALKRMR